MIDMKVLVRGGGDLSSAIVHKLHRCGFKVLVLETDNPLAIRRTVAFSEAVESGVCQVEEVKAQLVMTVQEMKICWKENRLPVMVDPQATVLEKEAFDVVIDAIMAKKNLGTHREMAPITIAVGPGFEAGVDVDVVIESNRGHNLGRLIFQGVAEQDTGIPGNIAGFTHERVFRSPADGFLKVYKKIGDLVKIGDVIAEVDEMQVKATIGGVLRGLIKDNIWVTKGLKIADVDPRGEVEYCHTISDKGRNIAGGVLEAILILNRQ